MKVSTKLPIGTIKSGLKTLTDEQKSNLTSDNIVSIDAKKLLLETRQYSSSIRLVRWVEPYNEGGVDYSLFYTEVDHFYKVGDKVFIEGGVYDFDAFISDKDYTSGYDGYKVLFVDRCRLVLDIEFTGDLPTNEEPLDNFVKVYVANTQYEFDYYLQTVSMRQDSGVLQNKFERGLNNFLYLNGTFTYQSNPISDSFVILDSGNLIDITTDVLDNDFNQYLNSDFMNISSPFYNNGKLRIMNSFFEIGDLEFEYERVYKFHNNTWKVDKSYSPTIITKSHFKRGKFKSGEFNSGLFGQHDERIKWDGDSVNWNLGTTLNVDWLSGVLGSNKFFDESNFTIFDRDGLPKIRNNASNNGGSGYNYIFDTDFIGGDVINGNIYNMSVILGTASTDSALSSYYDGSSLTYSINLMGGVYYNSDVQFANIDKVTFIASIIRNSHIKNSKCVNSQLESSVFLNSNWISDKIVKIQAYEESNVTLQGEDWKMYKFYINENNWRRIREFQNFYIQDLIINITYEDILNFFDDKFSIGNWTQTYDTILGKEERKVIIQLSTKEENRNSPGSISGGLVNLQPNFEALPSIDIFITPGENFNVGTSSSFPRPFIADTIDISKAYILDSDFVSGLFKDSKWISGNYINYNSDYSFETTPGLGYTASFDGDLLSLNIGGEKRLSTINDIVWANGLWYQDSNNLVKLNDTYKIINLNSDPISRVIDLDSIDGISIPQFSGTNNNLITKGAKNRWNYLHPVKFENSIIQSGLFRRAYFDSCKLENVNFDNSDKDLRGNVRQLLLSDIIFDGDNNTINNGLIQHSHIISGNDKWNGGIFHRSVWNGEEFTYKLLENGVDYKAKTVPFKSGVFRNSTWITGEFKSGLFYRNMSNLPGLQIYSNNRQEYYFSGVDTRFSWQGGTFLGGDFEKSNFELGEFKGGNFYDSNFLKGVVTGGNFGKTNIQSTKTRVYSGTFSNVIVLSADFRAEDETSSTPGLTNSIYWESGIFNGGFFTNKPNNVSIWESGTFNNGEFSGTAVWKGGVFNGGKFISHFGYVNGITPFELSNYPSASFSWQGGEFNGGEFGTGVVGTNSLWLKGEFNGGQFKGRYWKDGLFTRGEFLGSGTIDENNINYNEFITGFNSNYYGFWQDGVVSKTKDKWLKDEKIFTDLERVSTSRRKDPKIKFDSVLWNSGTFSSFDGLMENSVWLSGAFEDGEFKKSAFNPYINLAWQGVDGQNILEPGKLYTRSLYNNNIYTKIPFTATNKTNYSITGTDFTIYPGTQSGFRDDAIWKGGIMNESDIWYSTWEGGIFKSNSASSRGNAWGIIWKGGIVEYMNAYNVFWEGGVWRNGNWNGSPFTDVIKNNGNKVKEGFVGDIIRNISTYKENDDIHLNNIFDSGGSSDLVFRFPQQPDVPFTLTPQNPQQWELENNIWKSYALPFQFFIIINQPLPPQPVSSFISVENIFNKENVSYSVELRYQVKNVGKFTRANNDTIAFEVVIGDTNIDGGFSEVVVEVISLIPPSSFAIKTGESSIKTKSFNFIKTNSDVTSFRLRRLGNDGTQQVIIHRLTIIENELSYADDNNNLFGLTSLNLNNLNLPDSIFLEGLLSRYGNGEFISGIWENGVWLEGWRDDKTVIWVDDLSKFSGGKNKSYQVSSNTWNLELNILTKDDLIGSSDVEFNKYNGEFSNYKLGDKVAVGNIVAIDLNGDRRLITNYLTVVGKDDNSLKLEVDINFPIVSIQKDSEEHLIYITKNVWLNGVFLNGKFLNGVWNNGFFRGNVDITQMIESHWISGTFKGGLFRGFKGKYLTSPTSTEPQVEKDYHKSVIQKFTFYDENLSELAFDFKFNSWIDVNYFNTSGVNLNKLNVKYSATPLDYKSPFIENNWYGFATKDVLDSISFIRNGYDLETRSYKLGWKYKEFNEWIPFDKRISQFNDINHINYKNIGPTGSDKSLALITNLSESETLYNPLNGSGFGINNLLSDGWTFSYGSGEDGWAGNFIGDVNFDSIEIETDLDSDPLFKKTFNTPQTFEFRDSTNGPKDAIVIPLDKVGTGKCVLWNDPDQYYEPGGCDLSNPISDFFNVVTGTGPGNINYSHPNQNNPETFQVSYNTNTGLPHGLFSSTAISGGILTTPTPPIYWDVSVKARFTVVSHNLTPIQLSIALNKIEEFSPIGSNNYRIGSESFENNQNPLQKPITFTAYPGPNTITINDNIWPFNSYVTQGENWTFVITEYDESSLWKGNYEVIFDQSSFFEIDFVKFNYLPGQQPLNFITGDLATPPSKNPDALSAGGAVPTGCIKINVNNVGVFNINDVIKVDYTTINPPNVTVDALENELTIVEVGPNFIKVCIGTQSIPNFISQIGGGGITGTVTNLSDPGSTTILTNFEQLSITEERSLVIRSGRSTPIAGDISLKSNHTLDVINNFNIDGVENLRYCFVEIDATNISFNESLPNTIANPYVFYNNFPSTYSISVNQFKFDERDVLIPINQLYKKEVANQKEYFFNKRNLDLTLLGTPEVGRSGRYSVAFDKIRFVETDMIPFFKFADDCVVIKTITEVDSDTPTTPDDFNFESEILFLDYGPISSINSVTFTQSGTVELFTFYVANSGSIGIELGDNGSPLPITNINTNQIITTILGNGTKYYFSVSAGNELVFNVIGFGALGTLTLSQLTLNYVTFVNNNVNDDDEDDEDDEVIECISYINETIQIPFVAKAPDIDYFDVNFDFSGSTTISIFNI